MLAHGAETVSDDDFRRKAVISSDADEHVERLLEVVRLGATTLSLMNVSAADPEGAIRMYGDEGAAAAPREHGGRHARRRSASRQRFDPAGSD